VSSISRHHLHWPLSPSGAVALVGHLLVGDALELPLALLDGPIDVFGRHAVLPGGHHRGPQPRIGVDVAAPHARGDRYLFDELGEELPAARVLVRLLVLDRAPLGMTRHGADR